MRVLFAPEAFAEEATARIEDRRSASEMMIHALELQGRRRDALGWPSSLSMRVAEGIAAVEEFERGPGNIWRGWRLAELLLGKARRTNASASLRRPSPPSIDFSRDESTRTQTYRDSLRRRRCAHTSLRLCRRAVGCQSLRLTRAGRDAIGRLAYATS